MGCTSKEQVIDDENEIKNYDERDNFYSFHQKKKNKNKNLSLPNNKDKNNKNNDTNSEEDDNNSENEKKKEDLDRDNSFNKNNNNNDNNKTNNNNDNNKNNNNNNADSKKQDENNTSGKNSNSPNKKQNNKKKKNNINKEGNEISDSNLFKENTGEMEYYTRKLNQKKEGIKDIYDSNYSKVMYDYKNMFTDKGEKIPEYKVYAKNHKKNKENNKYIKKSKLNGIIIVEDLKDYFPKDISRDEIQELIFEAFGDNIVEDDDLIIPGQTASYDQVLQLCDYVFNFIKGNEKKMKENNALQKLNIKIDLVPLDNNLIKDKLYKGKDLSEKKMNGLMETYKKNKNDVKVLTIEFL